VPVPDEILVELGRILAASGILEGHTQLLARELLHPREDLAPTLLSGMTHDRVLQVLPRLAELTHSVDERDLVQAFVDKANTLRGRRNELNHAMIGLTVSGSSWSLIHIKRARKTGKITHEQVDVAKLRVLADDLEQTAGDVMDVLLALWPSGH
jgi:hypothetical protein